MHISKHLSGLITIVLCIITLQGFSQSNQTINLKSGSYSLSENIDKVIDGQPVNDSELINGYYYRIVQFDAIPDNDQRLKLEKSGVKLMDYIPTNAFYAKISRNAELVSLKNNGAIGVNPIEKRFKLTTKIIEKSYNEWALDNNGQLSVVGIYFDGIAPEKIEADLNRLGAEILMHNEAEMLRFKIDTALLDRVFNLSAFYYFEQMELPSQPENVVGATNHRSNNLATAYTNGLNYDGSGVTLMLQDNSLLDEHIDYKGRFTDDEFAFQSGDHGEHCGGIIAGAGNIDPVGRGMAYGAKVINYGFDNDNYNEVPSLYENSNMTITSKSYGNGLNDGYTVIARQMDQQVRNMPSLIHVFSAGNSNGLGQTSAGGQWFNITGGHKSAKNVLAVGNVTLTDEIATTSSRGPSEDGRIKPDICAVGTDVYSTTDPQTYTVKTGTSMACPGVAGTLAQLYQAYKDVNGGLNPPSGLIKAAVLNTADDLGNSGPDYRYGWGRINARRAHLLLSQNNYIIGNIDQSQNISHTITVPQNTEQLKVMVYWNDYEASPSAATALVSDLDSRLITPNDDSFEPWVLNTIHSSLALNQPAIRGVDHLNNMEQITIDDPVSGDHTLEISGFSLPQGVQTYYVVYEFINDDVVLTYPIGGEGINNVINEVVRWDAFGDFGTFTLEYSDDNGDTWNLIADDISGSERSYNWNVPSITTGLALVRVSRNGHSSESHAPFSIIRVPKALNTNWVCDNYMEVKWSTVTGATGYEVSVLGEKYMEPVGTTTNTSLIIPVSGPDGTWWSVKALGPDNCVGQRAKAKFQSAGTVNCSITTDVAANYFKNGPDEGVLHSCTQSDLKVNINITNLGFSAIDDIPVHFRLNNGSIVSEVAEVSISPGATVTYVFEEEALLMEGENKLLVWSDLSGDQIAVNDTIHSVYNLINSTSVLRFTEDFETFPLCGTNNNCEQEECIMINDFINEKNGTSDDVDWRTNEGETPSQNTGPSMDYNPGTADGNYIYLETSDDESCAGKAAHLISPCVDLTEADIAELSFAYHMYGKNVGSLHIDLLVNGAWIEDIIPAYSGDKGNQWLTAEVDLKEYIGNVVNIRFRGITGNGNEGNIAIDDIKILGIGDDDNILDFLIYPNPSAGLYQFDYNGLSDLTIEVHDVNGRLVHSSELKGGELAVGEIDLRAMASGVYMISLTNGADHKVQKVVKE